MTCPLCDYQHLTQNQTLPVSDKAATWFDCPICGSKNARADQGARQVRVASPLL